MVTSDLVHSRVVKSEKEIRARFVTAAASLFPILSYNPEETANRELKVDEEVFWIDGTVTVSF